MRRNPTIRESQMQLSWLRLQACVTHTHNMKVSFLLSNIFSLAQKCAFQFMDIHSK